ncbi:hypothetical protein T440DRAFT_39040 [Plenodomus tracheiphilus IPT5]|uniref:Uncharacterized protein n=1 Tax=Plenodomus tracheiphilus IPT5 TaxID=1408161 RepID=A0A6A7BAA8_9PLEO|nr:hypothetical protein T440DRAFT_39040 [Plenodomus tracheiphilus IPT5]
MDKQSLQNFLRDLLNTSELERARRVSGLPKPVGDQVVLIALKDLRVALYDLKVLQNFVPETNEAVWRSNLGNQLYPNPVGDAPITMDDFGWDVNGNAEMHEERVNASNAKNELANATQGSAAPLGKELALLCLGNPRRPEHDVNQNLVEATSPQDVNMTSHRHQPPASLPPTIHQHIPLDDRNQLLESSSSILSHLLTSLADHTTLPLMVSLPRR